MIRRKPTSCYRTTPARWITERPNLRPRTVELYRWLLGRHITPHLGNLRLADLDGNPAVIRTWRAALLDAGVSPSMAAKAYRLIRAALATAADDEIIRRSPCRIRGAGTETTAERPTLTVDQVAALAAQMPARYAALVQLVTYASLRWGEVTALHRSDLDLDRAAVRVRRAYTELSTGQLLLGPPKSRAGVRTVGFPRALVALLRRHLDEYAESTADGLVFTGAKGGPLRRSTFGRVVRWPVAVEAVGVPGLHFHDLRHTGNELAAQVPGTTVRDLMARKGHDNERAAMIYLHATQDPDRRIADALPVDLGEDDKDDGDEDDGDDGSAGVRVPVRR